MVNEAEIVEIEIITRRADGSVDKIIGRGIKPEMNTVYEEPQSLHYSLVSVVSPGISRLQFSWEPLTNERGEVYRVELS